jgi:hypothetical protein
VPAFTESDLLRRLETVKNKIEAVSNSPIVYDVWILHWLQRVERQLIALYESTEYEPRRGQNGITL